MKENCTILWAEDDQDDIDLILEAAKDLRVDHLIDFVRNGEEALNKLFRSSVNKILPQLIVLDNNMPVMSGAEALNRIVKHDQLKTIPIAFFTTGKIGSELHRIHHHAQVFLKPSSYSSFLETIKDILELCEQPSGRSQSSFSTSEQNR